MVDQSRSIQWAVWGNETVLHGAFTLLMGGLIGIIGGNEKQFLFWFPMGIYGVIFGFLICLLEYPRAKKNEGHSVPRFKQVFLSDFLSKASFLKNYNYRSVCYVVVCLPACLILPTFLGSIGILFGCIIYVIAAHGGESWSPIVEKYDVPTKTTKNFVAPPTRPPPRLPVTVS